MRGTLAALVWAWALVAPAAAGAAGVGSLEAKLSGAKEEAGAIASSLREAQGQLAAAQGEAAAADAREEQLNGLLAEGEAHAAELRGRVERSERRLAVQRRRLGRAKGDLAQRLVAIYESGSPSEASVILSASDYEELTTRAGYLAQIKDADAALARRVADVRDAVRGKLERVSTLKARADAYDERLASARTEISSVRERAETAASQLRSVTAARAASLSTLKSKISGWVGDIEEAEAASRESAEETVGRWLGGPYSIPTYIVMCESGGDYGAVNPSSGAGGAYQILPSTWALYGGKAAPQDASKSEQDSIAAQIWADSGPSAWVCG
ncbi:MAG: transglycosylase family protein [Solirubrobacterales bacterium]